ncbi:hypothetical protein CRUP_000010, partial [Coryphaenoides rupestris]
GRSGLLSCPADCSRGSTSAGDVQFTPTATSWAHRWASRTASRNALPSHKDRPSCGGGGGGGGHCSLRSFESTLQEKASQARQPGNSRRSSTRASASLALGMVSMATRSAPADTRHSI